MVRHHRVVGGVFGGVIDMMKMADRTALNTWCVPKPFELQLMDQWPKVAAKCTNRVLVSNRLRYLGWKPPLAGSRGAADPRG